MDDRRLRIQAKLPRILLTRGKVSEVGILNFLEIHSKHKIHDELKRLRYLIEAPIRP